MTVAFLVKAIRVQRISILANRAAIVIIAASGPLILVFIGLMTAAINHTPGMKICIHGMKIGFKTEPGISGHSIHA
jgi:hypothetical protein